MGNVWSSGFVQAAQDGDLNQVQVLWSARQVDDIDVPAEGGRTALLVAVHFGHEAVVKWLLERGASPHSLTPQGIAALELAVARGHRGVAAMLLDYGAAIDASSGLWPPALHLAVTNQNVGMLEYLLERGAWTEIRSPDGNAPLQTAAIIGALEVVEWLLVYGANASVRDADGTGKTPMLLAAQGGRTAVVKRLLDHDTALAMELSRDGYTPLLRACDQGHLSVVETIVSVLGRDHRVLETPNYFGQTPLMLAALSGHEHIVRLLIDHNVALETKDMRGFTALMFAANQGHAGVATQLIVAGAEVAAVDRAGDSALNLAAKRGHPKAVDVFLAHGAMIDRTGIYSATALMSAAAGGHIAIVESLLKNGASVHVKTHRGWPPVMYAAQGGHVDVMQLLVEHGASLDIQSDDHWTPLTIAIVNGHASLCAFLLEHSVSLSVRTNDGQTALHYAVVKGYSAIVELLLEYGADVNTVDHSGQTPSASAALEGHFDILELVIRAGAQPLDESTYHHATWPLPAIHELYNPHTHVSESTPPVWFVDPSRISAVVPTPCLTTPLTHALIATWSGTRVLVLKLNLEACQYAMITETEMRQLFQHEVSRWFPLRHPHVARLFGACHHGAELFLVAEHPTNGTLRSYLVKNPSRVWAKLYEVALGLQYLHERGIVHGNLMGEHLLIGEDGTAKLAGFGLKHSAFVSNQVGADARSNQSSVHEHPFVWDAWEVVRGSVKTMESDMYSLGMCILEAVSGDVPYAAEIAAKCDLKNLICWGILPERPQAMSDRAWALFTQMTSHEYVDRFKIADVVRELAALAREEDRSTQPVQSVIAPQNAVNIDLMADAERVEELLAIVWSLIGDDEDAREPKTPQHQVFDRVLDISTSIDNMDDDRQDIVRPQLASIIARFTNDLQARAGMSNAASFAAERQYANHIFSLHNDIDRVIEQLDSAQLTPNDPVHTWRDNWHAHRRRQLQAFGESFTRIEERDIETSTCLLFELTRHRSAYTSIAPHQIQAAYKQLRSKPGVRVPDWFIPHYEVAFNEFQSFSRGAFGSVHHGEWMGSRAVIKKVFSTDQENDDGDSEFTKEVELWSQLYHPHVLQLFGACHVGQKILVSEFATYGQLDVYLRKLGRQSRHEVWRLLYEAALGLEYLHARGIVHCDLKCNNILVGRDGKAKLSDYGLSRKKTARQSEDTTDVSLATPERVGAPRWKAPEVLNGADPTFESDVYGFAMCVVEAVTGDYPWGSRDRDELVSDHVRRGGVLFSKPREFSDAQWELVVGACRFEPNARLQLEEIIVLLKTFADASESAEAAVEGAAVPGKRIEPDPEHDQASESAAFSKLAIAAAVDDRLIGLFDSEPNAKTAQHASYSESW